MTAHNILNGRETVEGAKSDNSPRAGSRCSTQGVTDESGLVKFRKVEIKPL